MILKFSLLERDLFLKLKNTLFEQSRSSRFVLLTICSTYLKKIRPHILRLNESLIY